jgi:hypothetical protein
MNAGKVIKAACLVMPLLLMGLLACKTYTIPVDSFKHQFAPSKASPSKSVTTIDPWGKRYSYHTLNVDSIQVVDKNGKTTWLKSAPSLEMRVTHSGGKRTVFYFDLTRFDGDTIEGSISRLIPTWKKKVPISTVSKIEIQNGGKNYHYKK